jgi:hypothetical protein
MSTEAAITELVLVDVVLIEHSSGYPVQAEIVRNWTPEFDPNDFVSLIGYVPEIEPLALRILPGQGYRTDTITALQKLCDETIECINLNDDEDYEHCMRRKYSTANVVLLRRDQFNLASELLLAGWQLKLKLS